MKPRTISEQARFDIEQQEDAQELPLIEERIREYAKGLLPSVVSGEDPPQEKEDMVEILPPTDEELKQGIIKFKICLPGGRP